MDIDQTRPKAWAGLEAKEMVKQINIRQKTIRPRWWTLYLTFLSGLSLLFVESQIMVSANLHRFIEIGIVLLMFGLVFVWLSANQQGLMQEDRERYRQAMRDAAISQLFQPGQPDSAEPILHTQYDSQAHSADHRA
jgi:hypothetical protein